MPIAMGGHFLDLLGLPCPLNWARAKALLETMARGETVELLVDDPRAALDIPRAAEAEGFAVVSVSTQAATTRITIER
ncbi:MAG: sulfurtransferase TusA family protein [Deltaproteobacteria bacterium]